MRINNCPSKETSCYASAKPVGRNTQLNVHGPMQVGGLSFEPRKLQANMNWNDIPATEKFVGCIQNVTFKGEGRTQQVTN